MKEKLPNNLIEFIKNGEGTTVEYKEAKKNLPSSLFESICSMLNRNGGHIFLGVKDDSEVVGVYKDYIKNMKKSIFYIFMFMKALMYTNPQIKYMIGMKMGTLI